MIPVHAENEDAIRFLVESRRTLGRNDAKVSCFDAPNTRLNARQPIAPLPWRKSSAFPSSSCTSQIVNRWRKSVAVANEG